MPCYSVKEEPSLLWKFKQRIKDWDYIRKERRLYKLLDSLSSGSNIVDHIDTEFPGGNGGDEMQDAMKAHLIRMGQLFSIEGHSGFSANYAIGVLNKLLKFEPLGPLTGEESEWCYLDYDDDVYAQNKRCSHVFMRKDGSAYDSEGRVFREPDGVCFTSSDSRVEIEFPYTPTVEYVDVEADR